MFAEGCTGTMACRQGEEGGLPQCGAEQAQAHPLEVLTARHEGFNES